MTSQAQADRIWEIVFRAAERDPAIRALLFAKPGSGEPSNPGHLLLSTPLPAVVAHPGGCQKGAGATCSECRWFDGEEGWCGLHNSANWPDVPACRLGELR